MQLTFQAPDAGQGLPVFYAQYLADFAAVASFFTYDPWDDGSFSRRAAALDRGRSAPREQVAAALVEYNQRLGAAPSALAGAGALGRPGTLAVVTGQQAGLLTGPLFTVFKAVTAIRLARRLQEQLQREVVPVFWVASEDHDFEEVRAVHMVDTKGRLRRLRLPGTNDGRSIGHRPVPRHVDGLLREAAAIMGPRLVHDDVLTAAVDAAANSSSLAEWFARLMSQWLSEFGLVIMDPMEPALRALVRDIYPTALLRREAVTRELAAAGQRLERRGFTPGLNLTADHAFIFHYHQGRRTALFWRDGRLADREGRFSLSVSEMSRLLREQPQDFSPNVVTRPMVQDYLLPTVAQVVGPGELLYLAQMREVYPLFDLEMPVLVPRLHLTLVEPEVSAALERQGIALSEAWADPAGAGQRRLAALDPVGIDQVMDDLRRQVAAAHGDAMSALAPLGDGLAKIGRGNLERILKQVDYLHAKAWQHHRRRQRETTTDLRLLEHWLRPMGQLQERVLTSLPFVARYGRGLFRALLRAPAVRGHQFAIAGPQRAPSQGAPF